MVCTPFVKPTAPELGTHQGAVGTHLFQFGKLLVDVGSRSEVHRPYQVIKSVVEEIRGPVALKHRDIIAEIPAQHVADFRDILLVLAIRAIFILDLHHYDRPTVGYGQVSDLLGHLLLKLVYTFKKPGIGLTQAYILFLEQPPGQSAHLPLRADIRAGAQNHLHVIGLAELDKHPQIILAGEVKIILRRLVGVPEHI